MCVIEDKTAVIVVASYCSVSRNPIRFKALAGTNFKFIVSFRYSCTLSPTEKSYSCRQRSDS